MNDNEFQSVNGELTAADRKILENLEPSDIKPEPPIDWTAETENIAVAGICTDPDLLDYASVRLDEGAFKLGTNKWIAKTAFQFRKDFQQPPTAAVLVHIAAEEFGGKPEFAKTTDQIKLVYSETTVQAVEKLWLRKVFNRQFQYISAGRALKAFTKDRDFDALARSIEIARHQSSATTAAACFTDDEWWTLAEETKDRWIVPDRIAFGKLHLFVGQKKLGKSTTLYSLMPAMLQGDLWLDTIPVVSSPVIYLNWEDPVSFAHENLALYGLRRQEPEFFRVRREALPAFLTPGWLDRLIERENIPQPCTVVFNACLSAFRQAFPEKPGWDNLADCVRSVMDPLADWCHLTGNAVVAVHHTNKSGVTGGSAQWEACCDLILRFHGEMGTKSRHLDVDGRIIQQPARLTFTKQESGKLVFGKCRLEEESEKLDKVTAAQENAFDKIKALLPTYRAGAIAPEGITAGEIIEALKDGVSKNTVYRSLGRMVESGDAFTRELQTGKRGKPVMCYWQENEQGNGLTILSQGVT